MGVFFGTDGLRGKVNEDLTSSVAYRCGNSLSALDVKRIIIGRDTRGSGNMLLLAFACGAVSAGIDVVDVGVCPTAGISYLTKLLDFDYGVVISASHNPVEFNGIKIFDKSGEKITEKTEEIIERNFLKQNIVTLEHIGKFESNYKLINKYIDFLIQSIETELLDKTIVLDCSNGASYKIAPKVFKKTGAKIITTYSSPNKININKNCGCLNIQKLKANVIKHKADFGFAFDGDSDRVIAVDEIGSVIDGDLLVYLFAKHYKNQNKLKNAAVVGTHHTNMGVEIALNNIGITLYRTDIGDRYVSEKLNEMDLCIGGEQSGHIFVKDKLSTGDGILNALLISEIIKNSGDKLSNLVNVKKYEQCNLNVKVKNKIKIINSKALLSEKNKQENVLLNKGRLMVRMSGTEPFIRIMVETLDKNLSEKVAEEIAKEIKKIDEDL